MPASPSSSSRSSSSGGDAPVQPTAAAAVTAPVQSNYVAPPELASTPAGNPVRLLGVRETGRDAQRVVALVEKMKGELLQWIEALSTLKMWIQLRVPRVEDGNNFGVAVQEEAIQVISSQEDHAFAIMENLSKWGAACRACG
jgi:hypothetical protein